VPAAYTTRLRLEGAVLAAAGVAGSALLLAKAPEARRWPASTIGQVAVVVVLMTTRAPKAVAGWMAEAQPVDGVQLTGEPTPLHHVPVPMVLGALLFKGLQSLPLPAANRAGWDAALRVTAGSAVVGAAQALVLARAVAEAEARQGRVYFRLPGSRLGSGTRLGYTER
jgi:hypothetical protein